VTQDLFDRYRVIDTDTHITEPPDVWTSRLPARWVERGPHVERVGGRDVWMIEGQPVGAPGYFSMAGFDGTFPDAPLTYDDIPTATFDAAARLAHMDAQGIHAQVLYPNVGGFGSGRFISISDVELKLACVRAYNDFLLDWTAADRSRLLPVMATPFWDVPATVAEIERCATLGHRAVLMCGQPQAYGQPVLSHRHWDPVWTAAEEAGLPISFHVGGGDLTAVMRDAGGIGIRAHFARFSALTFFDNAACIADLVFGGICHRFPRLRFVSVESGSGWLPSLLESFDWQWRNGGVRHEHPEYDLLPSEYFRRQIYGCFWFEEEGLRRALELYPGNLLYETDYPHPTSMSPGPQSAAVPPRRYAERALSGLDVSIASRVLHDNAAALYGVA